jgi:hypothetical protein
MRHLVGETHMRLVNPGRHTCHRRHTLPADAGPPAGAAKVELTVGDDVRRDQSPHRGEHRLGERVDPVDFSRDLEELQHAAGRLSSRRPGDDELLQHRQRRQCGRPRPGTGDHGAQPRFFSTTSAQPALDVTRRSSSSSRGRARSTWQRNPALASFPTSTRDFSMRSPSPAAAAVTRAHRVEA